MKVLNYFFVTFLLISVSFSCSNDEENSTEIPELNLVDISYGSDSDQKYDIFLPANRNSSTKTIILIHGGSWTEGDKSDMNALVYILRSNFPNYAVCNINYRLANTNRTAFPIQLDDIQTIISKLKTSNYNISNQYGLIGISAGAHLAMLYSYTRNTTSEIKIVGSVVGPTNFSDSDYTNNPDFTDLFLTVAGTTYQENPTYINSLSPLFTATSSAPPTALFYGNNDPLVPYNQGPDLHNKLNQLNVYNEFYMYNGGHLSDWSFNDFNDMNVKLTNFIRTKF